MKKILHKPSGTVYEYSDILASRDDVEVIEEVDGVQLVETEKPKRKKSAAEDTEASEDF